MKTNKHEAKVLLFLADRYGTDCFYSFRAIAQDVRLNRKQIRLACRSLTRKGLATFARGLWTEDGCPAGSGYGATKAGAELVSAEGEAK